MEAITHELKMERPVRLQPRNIYPHGFVSGSSRPASQGVTHPRIALVLYSLNFGVLMGSEARVLVKPNEPYILQRDDDDHGNPKRLRISQASILAATLADRSGLWTSRSVVRCAVGSKPPVFICSLSIGEVASCKLDLEFEEKDDVVFSVKGPRGVHLAGYFLNSTGANSTSATVTTNAPNPLDGKEEIAKPSCEGPNNFNSQDRNTTNIDELEVGVGEYSRIKSVDRMASDAKEEHLNEKTNKSCEEVGKIQAADSQDKSLSISPQKKLKEVEVGDGSSEKAGFDLPDKVMEDDDTHLEKYIIREEEPFQQEQDQYIVKEGGKEITKEMAASGSCKREEKSPKRPKVGKRRSGQHDGNPKGGDLSSLDYMEDRARCCEKDRKEKNVSLANNINQRQNKIVDDQKIE
ncbi:hypothetical protein LguiB_020331 [Lonicera macranthoides]